MNKSIIVLTALSLLTVVAGTATAAVHQGTILAGNPVSSIGAGPTEVVFECDEGAPTTGVDAQWFNVAGEGTQFELIMDPGLDADVYFYDAGCSWLDDGGDGAEGGAGVTETGDLPTGTAYAIVVGAFGSGAFTLTVS